MKKRILSMLLVICLFVTMICTGTLTAQGTQQYYSSLAKEIADEGMVLLENDGSLPLAKGTNVALFGKGYIDYYPAGGGSGLLSSSDVITPTMAFSMAAKDGRINFYQPLDRYYHSLGAGLEREPEIPATYLDGAKEFADTAVIFISRFSEEGYDRTAVEGDGDYYLSDAEKNLITTVDANFDKVIIVLNITGVMDTSWFKGENAIIDPSAVLVAWLPGIQGANSIVDIITGVVNPSGKLVDTFAKDYTDYPSSETFSELNTQYTEDIFVGYRYFDTIPGAAQKVNYWFGYGLSYTTFEHSNQTVTSDGSTITVSVKVTNTGSVAGKDVVALYFGHPDDTQLYYANKELCAYQKTGLLDPGQSETVTLSFEITDMAGFDSEGIIQKSAYVLEAGEYPIYSGNDLSTVKKIGVYAVAETFVTEQLSALCVPTQLSKILQADGTYKELETSTATASVNTITADGTSQISAVSLTTIENPGALTYIEKDYIERFNQSQYAKIYYELNVEETGTYTMYSSVASRNVNADDIWGFYLDGVEQTNLQLNVTNTSAVGYYVWRYFNTGEITLTKGRHTFMIYVKTTAGVNFRGFSFVPQGEELDYNNPVVTILPDAATILNATSFIDMIPASSVNYNSNITGGYVERYNTNYGSTLWYVVEAEKECTLALYLNRAQSGTGGTAQYKFTVNGTDYSITHEQPNTGAWTTFATQKAEGTVTFQKGKNILGITPITECKSNIQNFIFLPVGQEYSSEIGKVGDNSIKFKDVVEDNTLIDAFIEQFTMSEIGDLVRGSAYFECGNIANYEIPGYKMANGPTGLREGNQKSYLPCGILMACTWNDILAYKFGVACGLDGRDSGIYVWLAPGTNIHRDPLCGRNFEYFSEDPFISGKMASAQINGAQYCGVAVTIKHFVANERENSRSSSDSIISERALREIYLEPFKIAVEESDPWAVMSSYNLLNGIETAESKDLMTGILRNEWNFNGIVFTDWNNNNSNQVKELLAGNDVKMPDTSGSTAVVVAAYESGTLSRQLLRETAKRIIEFYIKIEKNFYKDIDLENLGLLESGYVPENWSTEYLNKSIVPIKFVKQTGGSGFDTGIAQFIDSTEKITVNSGLQSGGWDNYEFKEGYASYSFLVSTTTAAVSKNVSIIANEGDECYFWIYFDNASIIKELVWEVASSGTYTGACVRYRINATQGYKLKDGWNKIYFTLHDSTALSTNAGDATSLGFDDGYSYYLGGGMTGNVDWSNINYIRVFTSTTSSDTYVKVNGFNIGINEEKTTYEAEDITDKLSFSAEWNNKNLRQFSANNAMYTSVGGNVEMKFTGDMFDIVGYKSSTQGKLYVSIDGAAEQEISLTDDSIDTAFQETVFSSKRLPYGDHTVTVRAEGKAYIDAVKVRGTLGTVEDHIEGFDRVEVENNDAVALNGSWATKYAWKHSEHSAVQTKNGGTASFTYTGYDFKIVSYKSASQGKLYVSIDSAAPIEVDLYDETTDVLYQAEVFESADLHNGTHTVEITTEGAVYLDALLIDGTLN